MKEIKPNELRIGSILEYNVREEGAGWTPCAMDWQDIKLIEEDPESFNKHHRGIPLTEELLKGLELGEQTNEHPYTFKLGGLEFFWEGVGFKVFAMNSPWYFIECEYVHTLQNLSFALTNKEINIESIINQKI